MAANEIGEIWAVAAQGWGAIDPAVGGDELSHGIEQHREVAAIPRPTHGLARRRNRASKAMRTLGEAVGRMGKPRMPPFARSPGFPLRHAAGGGRSGVRASASSKSSGFISVPRKGTQTVAKFV